MPEGTGKVAFATSLISYLTIFASFGVSTYGVRAIAQVRDNKLELSKRVHEILFINFIGLILSYIMLFVSLAIIDELKSEYILFLISSLSIIFTIVGVEWLYKGLEEYKYITTRTIVVRTILLLLTFLLVRTESDYLIFAAISVLSAVGSGVINLINLKNKIYIGYLRKYQIKQHIKPMFFLFLTSLAITIYTNTDAAMLGLLKGNVEVGYYNAAVRIKSILLAVVTSLGVVLLPRLSYFLSNNLNKEFNDSLNNSMAFIFVISLPAMLLLLIYSPNIILILAGNEYYNSILPLQILAPTIVIVGITNILGIQLLLPKGRELSLLLTVSIGAILNILLNLSLIPSYAEVGTSVSNLITELVILLAQIAITWEYRSILFAKIQYIKIIVALLVSIIISYNISNYLTNDMIGNLLISAIIFIFAYLALLFTLKERFAITSYLQLKSKYLKK